MSESEGINIPITATDEFSEAFNQAISSMQQYSNSVAEVANNQNQLVSSDDQVVTSSAELSSLIGTQNENFFDLSNTERNYASAVQAVEEAHQNLLAVENAVQQAEQERAEALQNLNELQSNAAASSDQ